MSKPAKMVLAGILVCVLGADPASTAEKENVISQRERDYARINEAAEKLKARQMQVEAKEVKVRGGLPNFFAKANSGKPVVIAYFGGSITAHPGWRPQSFKAIQEMFPQSKMTMVNASVGGTGSVVGAFRADNDLIKHRPDLVFIEFAVNDGSSAVRDPKKIWRAQEGIVRKLRKSKPDTDICFFYTMQGGHLETLRKGFCYSAVAVHEQMASFYNLPSLYVGPAVRDAIDRGEAVFSAKVADRTTGKDADGKLVITEDGTHPVIPTGHAFYARVAERGIKTMNNGDAPRVHELPTPMMVDHWEKAKTIPVHGNATFTGNWEKLTAEDGPYGFRFGKRIYEWFPFLYRTASPGSSFTVKFRGTHVGFKGVGGPDSGFLKTKVDDQPETERCVFSVYNTRHAYGGGPLPALPEGVHTVTWTLSEKKPDKLAILKSYYRKGNEKDMLDNPERYTEHRLSVGEIILIGDIIE
jgi:hypothetical protein